MLNLFKLSASAIAAIMAAGAASAQPTCDAPLFATGFDGEPTFGAKDALAEAVNRGEPIRVGWAIDFDRDGVGELVHWADASFLTVWEGEVFAQINAIHTQSPKRGEGDVILREPYVEWRGALSSKGELDGRYSNGASFSSDMKAQITWCSTLQGERGWTLLYRNSESGEDLAGSKHALLSAIRSGSPIQIGWGLSVEREGETRSVEHLIAPVFMTITDGSHVTAQLPEHIAQRSYFNPDEAFFDDPSVLWRGLMTTKGSFDAVWVNRATGETVRRHPQRASLSWYAPVAPDLSTPTLAVPGGVIRDEARADERLPKQ